MNRRILLTLSAAALLWSAGAESALQNVENAYEISPAQMVLPASDVGQLTIRQCITCKPVLLATNAQTVYLIGTHSAPVPLAKFRAAASKNDKQLVVVYYRLDSKIVTRVVLAAKA